MRYSSSAEHALVELCCEVPNRILLIQPQPASCLGIGMSRRSHGGVGRVAAGDESAAPAAGFDDPGALQLAVGACDRVHSQPQFARQFPHCGQPGAGRQPAVSNCGDHRGPQLIEQRC